MDQSGKEKDQSPSSNAEYVTLRPMVMEDIPIGLALCRSAGWNQTALEWEWFIHQSPSGCHVAIAPSGQVVGTATTMDYQDHFSWIAMVLVDSDWQRKGIGTLLLEKVIGNPGQNKTTKLDATPAGREVYLKLGFRDEHNLLRMQSDFPALSASTAFTLRPDDLPAVLELDKTIFGADRSFLIKSLMAQFPQYAHVISQNGKITGYCFGRTGYRFTHIGPITAESSTDAAQLFSAAAKQSPGLSVIIDVLNQDRSWLEWLKAAGFTVQRPLIRMVNGNNTYPGIPERQFAILGPEFG